MLAFGIWAATHDVQHSYSYFGLWCVFLATLSLAGKAMAARRIDFTRPRSLTQTEGLHVQGNLFGVELDDVVSGSLGREVYGVGWQALAEGERAYVADLLGVPNPTAWEVPELAKIRVTYVLTTYRVAAPRESVGNEAVSSTTEER